MKSTVAVLFVVLLFLISVHAQAVVQYTVTDLGALGGAQSFPKGINANGEVVGYSDVAGQGQHAFLYSGGVMHDLDALMPGTGPYSSAYSINSAGQVVGYMRGAWGGSHSSDDHAFLYDGSTVTNLASSGSLQGDSYATGINTAGQVVGYIANGGYQAFLYSGGVLQKLAIGGDARGINDHGQITGTFYPSQHVYLYSNGTVTDLHSPSLGIASYATGINNNGQVIGWLFTASNEAHAFLYSDGKMQDLGALAGYSGSIAHGINNLGQVVLNASIYSNGIVTDLNSLIDPSSGWHLNEADAINDNGWIIGYGAKSDGKDHALLLTPVPEPSTLALLGMGGIGLIAWGWRRRK